MSRREVARAGSSEAVADPDGKTLEPESVSTDDAEPCDNCKSPSVYTSTDPSIVPQHFCRAHVPANVRLEY